MINKFKVLVPVKYLSNFQEGKVYDMEEFLWLNEMTKEEYEQSFTYPDYHSEDVEYTVISENLNHCLFGSYSTKGKTLIELEGIGEIVDNSWIIDDLIRAFIGAESYKFDSVKITKIYSQEDFFKYIDDMLTKEFEADYNYDIYDGDVSLRVVINSLDCPEYIKNKYPKDFLHIEAVCNQTYTKEFLERNEEIVPWDCIMYNFELTDDVVEYIKEHLTERQLERYNEQKKRYEDRLKRFKIKQEEIPFNDEFDNLSPVDEGDMPF